MLTLDVRRAVQDAAQDAVAAGELPAMPPPAVAGPGGQPADPSAIRPAPAAAPGRYASTLPYLLAGGGVTPGQAAAVLAARLAGLPWIARATAAGHLTITVTADTLAALAVRIPRAASCARSDLLRGLSFPAPPPADLAAAPGWAAAHAWVTAEITGRLAAEAGADIFPERFAPAQSPGLPAARPVQAALDWAGPDPVRYALLSRDHGRPALTRAELPVRHHPGNPAYAVRYAHAHASATLRQAADLGLGRGEAEEFEPRLVRRPQERALLDGMSWLPERVAGAARHRRPGELARYLEELAYAYLDCRENCPALPFGGHRAPHDPGTTRARLWLVTAARTAIGAGLDLLGISAPVLL